MFSSQKLNAIDREKFFESPIKFFKFSDMENILLSFVFGDVELAISPMDEELKAQYSLGSQRNMFDIDTTGIRHFVRHISIYCGLACKRNLIINSHGEPAFILRVLNPVEKSQHFLDNSKIESSFVIACRDILAKFKKTTPLFNALKNRENDKTHQKISER